MITIEDIADKVVTELLEGEGITLAVLRDQMKTARLQYERTETGFFANFICAPDVPLLPNNPDFELDDANGSLNKEKVPIGFTLFIRSGKLDFLEGYTFGEAVLPERIDNFELKLAKDMKRDKQTIETQESSVQAKNEE